MSSRAVPTNAIQKDSEYQEFQLLEWVWLKDDENRAKILRFNDNQTLFVGKPENINRSLQLVSFSNISKLDHDNYNSEVWYTNFESICQANDCNNIIFANFGKIRLEITLTAPFDRLLNDTFQPFRNKYSYYYWGIKRAQYLPYGQDLSDILYILKYHWHISVELSNHSLQHIINLEKLTYMNGLERGIILELPFGTELPNQQQLTLCRPIAPQFSAETVETLAEMHEKYLKQVKYPKHWGFPVNFETSPHTVEIAPDTELFDMLKNELSRTCPHKLVKAHQIINPVVFANYQRFVDMQKFSERTEHFMGEIYAYHGTAKSHAIIQHGFIYNFNTAGDYGRGNYVSLHADYSLYQFAPNSYDDIHCRHVLMCRAYIGNFMLGNNKIRGFDGIHHSTVNKLSEPSIFCCLNNAQIYPEFFLVIDFKQFS